ncbi:hypothetical protein ACE6H2_018194 [Prunus campanulata]
MSLFSRLSVFLITKWFLPSTSSSCLLSLIQLFEGLSRVVTSRGEAQEKVLEEVFERLKVFEGGMKEYLQGRASFSNGESLGLLDILMVVTFGPYKAHEEVLGFKMSDPERNPLLFSWVAAMKEHPVVKEVDPPHDKLVELLQFIKIEAPESILL